MGTTPLVAANIVTGAIKEFRGIRPDLHIQLFDSFLPAIVERIRAGKLDIGLGLFKPEPEIRRVPFFRFSLMVIRAEQDEAAPRPSMAWSALNGQTLISLAREYPHQRLIDRHLAKAGVQYKEEMEVNLLDTQIALVEAGQGMAIIPSFGLPVCRNRRVDMSWLTNPAVHLEFFQISDRGRKLPPEADEFTEFLKSHIARWAGRAGVL